MALQGAPRVLRGCSTAKVRIVPLWQTRAFTSSRHNPNAAESVSPSGQSPSSQKKREALEDRNAIDRQSDETSKSGTDDVVAAQSNIAFSEVEYDNDPSELRSKAERQSHWSNPLDASPANQSLSQQTAEVEGGAKKKTVIVKEETRSYRGKKATGEHNVEAGFEKRVFAGSTTGGKLKGKGHKDPPIVEQGVR
ncbi:hypothetical protein LTR84_006590 [Exophiala bonariae]|uniref:Srp40 C-terminal domain-containing protein n=1 Tax=Exophiala bonariae TaxID=1690606 RepID=A0AAV9N3V7_9EURO|nr:hypothetical protein LTR84_006590 [Exophiala bonariae]